MPAKKLGINLSGHLNSQSSIGMAARDNAKALKPICDIAFNDLPLRDNEDQIFFTDQQMSDRAIHGVNFLHFNPDQSRRFIDRYGETHLEGRKTIGFWVWECSKVLPRWREAEQYYDEIWTASDYCANIFREEFDLPVKVLTHPVTVASPSLATRDDFGIPRGKFAFLFAFDAWSRVERKNPSAVVEAFRIVKDQHPDCVLVVKHRHLTRAEIQELFGSISSDDVLLIDQFLSEEDLSALTSVCDCFVNLSRSEGFGLHVAEAMLLGTPVVSTGYSGTMHFTRDNNAWLVPFKMQSVERDEYYRQTGGEWANPDIGIAAEIMLEVIRSPGAAAEKAKRARAFIEDRHSFEAVTRQAIENFK